jgi:hypothetical protein
MVRMCYLPGRRLRLVNVGQGVQVPERQSSLPCRHLHRPGGKCCFRRCSKQCRCDRGTSDSRLGHCWHALRLRHPDQPRFPSDEASYAHRHLDGDLRRCHYPWTSDRRRFHQQSNLEMVFLYQLTIGAPIIALVVFFIHRPKHAKPAPATWKEIVLQLDVPGSIFLLASLVCLALALQQGGQTHAWSSGSTIALLVLWPVFTMVFCVIEFFQGARAIVPLAILKPRPT